MHILLNTFLLIIHISMAQLDKHDWDLAVANNKEITVLTSDGTFLNDVTASFFQVKALTFDNLQQKFIVSDMYNENDTIYPISLEDPNSDILPIVKNVSDDIQNLAFDPLDMTVYWADSTQRSIKSIPIRQEGGEKPKVIKQFRDKEPQHVVIHSCTRNLYFTNSIYTNPSIDRINLNTEKHQVLIDTDLITPVGITIDYLSNRIYWSDWGPGIYFRIESANLDGGDREVIIEDTYQQPFGLAVDTNFLYWTDITSNALYKTYKKTSSKKKNRIYKLRTFEEETRGLLSNYLGFAGTPSCKSVTKLINELNTCFNTGEKFENSCSCEVTPCLSYCIQRECNITIHGLSECHCHGGYLGIKCKNNICDNFCLNNGGCEKDFH